MSSTKSLLLLILVFLLLYTLWKPEYFNKIKQRISNIFYQNKKLLLTQQINNPDKTIITSGDQHLDLLNLFIDNFKNKTEILPINQPKLNQFNKLNITDINNILSYFKNILSNYQFNQHSITFDIEYLNENIFYAGDNNYLYFTPFELSGTLFIDNQKIGLINFTIIMRGKSNLLFVPKEGFFVSKNKYIGIFDDFKITKLNKNIHTNIHNNIHTNESNNNSLIKYTEIEDSEMFNLSEIINPNDNMSNQQIDYDSEMIPDYQETSETYQSEQFNQQEDFISY